MRRVFIVKLLFWAGTSSFSQVPERHIDSFRVRNDVQVTIDRPITGRHNKKPLVVFYALPNGNSTAMTMGKKMAAGDDWHFDIQHIAAQTLFLRQELRQPIIVVYLENDFKSWPYWKQRHPDYREWLPSLVDSLAQLAGGNKSRIYLNGHSGGGSFIFGYLSALKKIPQNVERISFIDSNYGYDSSYYPMFRTWLQENRRATLTVWAYNDSIALYNGKPLVSATGGTWYRSWRMVSDFGRDWKLTATRNDSLHFLLSAKKNIHFIFKSNPDRGIYHTQQVEYNGFIHSILAGTACDSKHYRYYGPRAYTRYIR